MSNMPENEISFFFVSLFFLFAVTSCHVTLLPENEMSFPFPSAVLSCHVTIKKKIEFLPFFSLVTFYTPIIENKNEFFSSP